MQFFKHALLLIVANVGLSSAMDRPTVIHLEKNPDAPHDEDSATYTWTGGENEDATIAPLNTAAFNGDASRQEKALQKTFDNFDLDRNGEIDRAEIEQQFNLVRGISKKHTEKARALVEEQITALDVNHDGKVTAQEFYTGVKQYVKTDDVANNKLCDQEAAAVKKCKSKIHEVKKEDDTIDLAIKINGASCRTEAGAAHNYTTQKCAIAAADCDELIRCYKIEESASPAVTEHKKELSKFWRFAFWTAIVVLGFVMVPTLIGLPFYIIIVYVALKTLKDSD